MLKVFDVITVDDIDDYDKRSRLNNLSCVQMRWLELWLDKRGLPWDAGCEACHDVLVKADCMCMQGRQRAM